MPDALAQQKIFPYDGGQDSTKTRILISPKDVVTSNNIVYTTWPDEEAASGHGLSFPTEPRRRAPHPGRL